MKASEFDKEFDSGKDISNSLDLSKIRRPLQEQRREEKSQCRLSNLDD